MKHPDIAIRLAVGAVSEGAKLFEATDSLYAAKLDSGRWTVWKLEPGSPEYYIEGDRCSCPSRKQPCKHLLAIRELEKM